MKTPLPQITKLLPLPLAVASAFGSFVEGWDTFETYVYAMADAHANQYTGEGYASVAPASGSIEGGAFSYGLPRSSQYPDVFADDSGVSEFPYTAGFDVDENEYHFARADAAGDVWEFFDHAEAWAQLDSNY